MVGESSRIGSLQPATSYCLAISAAGHSADSQQPPAASSMLEFTTLADLRAIRLTSQLLTFNRVLLRQIHT